MYSGHMTSWIALPLRRVTRVFRSTRRTVERIPSVLDAILVLPELARQLERVAIATATLPEMHEEIRRVRGDTAALPQIDETLAGLTPLLERIDLNTAGVRELSEVLVPLRGAAFRVGRFADRLPQRTAAAAASSDLVLGR